VLHQKVQLEKLIK